MLSLEFFLGAVLIPLVFGGYVYTWISNKNIWKAITHIKSNDIKHLEERVTKLESEN